MPSDTIHVQRQEHRLYTEQQHQRLGIQMYGVSPGFCPQTKKKLEVL